MKKTCYVVVCLCLIANILKAQENADEQKIRLGVICSPLISWGKSNNAAIEADGSRFGINVGLMFDRFFARNYAFATGISIHTMGASIKYKHGYSSFKTNDSTYNIPAGAVAKYRLRYIDVPLSIKMRTTQVGNTTLFAQLGVNVMANIKATADINSLKVSDADVRKDHIKPVYMGYHAMLGVEHKIIGNTSLVAGFQYMNGFTNVTSNIKLHNVEVRVGLIF
jgi:hypothetical protein